MKVKMIGIYQIRNTINNKRYIGSSSNIERRFQQHKIALRNNINKNKSLQQDYNKHGAQIFKFEVLEECLNENLLIREQYYMDLYGFNKELYNICPTSGSSLGFKHTSETKQKISIVHKGKSLTEEHKQNISKATSGIPRSEQAKRNMSIAQLGEKNHMYGKHHTKESKKKIGLSSKNRIWINKNGKCKMLKIETISQYINDGWVLGRISNPNKGTRYINKDGKCKRVKPEQLEQYISDDWVLGRTKLGK